MLKLKALFAAAALALAPLAASAVTLLSPLPAFDSQGFSFSAANPTTSQTYELLKPAKVAFAFSGTAPSEDGLSAMVYTIDGMDYGYASVTFDGALWTGTGGGPAKKLGPGFFTVAWGNGGLVAEGGYTLIAHPIPLPAAGWMLVSALGGMGLLARSRRKSMA